jgi:hypothetical protein
MSAAILSDHVLGLLQARTPKRCDVGLAGKKCYPLKQKAARMGRSAWGHIADAPCDCSPYRCGA